jgi:hypothetical protein
MTTLADILRGIECGGFPAPDLSVSVVPAPSDRDTCVVGLTAHIVVAADVDPAWVAERSPAGDLSAPLNPPFLFALEQLTGRRVNSIDAMLLAPALTDPVERRAATAELTELTDHDHPLAPSLPPATTPSAPRPSSPASTRYRRTLGYSARVFGRKG